MRFRIPNIDRRFTVHEDLICRTSAVFKTQLQKNRKLFYHDKGIEDCCVCQEDLNAITKDITYCVTCGQNVHDKCIEQWKRSSDEDKAPSCPMCRAEWKNECLLKNMRLEEQLDAEAVQMYLDWLYSGSLHVPAKISRRKDTFNLTVLKCWAVASAVEDDCFKEIVITTFFKEAKAQFWEESVRWAFVDDRANAEIKGFITEVYMAHMGEGWFKKKGAKWPTEFVMALADEAFKGQKVKNYEEIKKEWTRKLEGGDGAVGVEHDSEVEVLKSVPRAPYRTARAQEHFDDLRRSRSLSFGPRDAKDRNTSSSRLCLPGDGHNNKLRPDGPTLASWQGLSS